MIKSGKKIKRILLVVPKHASFYRPYTETFNKLGIEFKLFDNRKTVFWEKIIFLISLFYKPFYNLGTKMINWRLIRSANSYKPDLVLVIKGENISSDTVSKIKEKFAIVNYFSDYFRWFSDEQMQKWLNAYQIVYTGDLQDVKNYQAKGFSNLYHVHLAGPKVEKIPLKKKYDVVFIGAYSKEREEMFKPLDDFNFKIWGDKKWATSSLKKHYMHKWLSAEQTMDVFKNSKIVVNFHNDLIGKNRYINLRVFEATSAKALLISDVRKDLPTVFKLGKEIETYKNKNDLKNKVEYFLKHDEERKKIAQKGYMRCLKEHNYLNRLKQMFKVIPLKTH